VLEVEALGVYSGDTSVEAIIRVVALNLSAMSTKSAILRELFCKPGGSFVTNTLSDPSYRITSSESTGLE